MKPTSQQAILIQAVLAALQVLTGAAALGDVIGQSAMGLFVIVVAAVQVGYATYNQAVQVVPASAVAAVVQNGAVVAGPAAAQTNGTPVTVATSAAR